MKQPTKAHSQSAQLKINNLQKQVKNKKAKETISPHTLLLGTKIGQCDICRETKKTLLLRFGFCLCEECLNVCTSVLERLQLDEKNRERIGGKETGSFQK